MKQYRNRQPLLSLGRNPRFRGRRKLLLAFVCAFVLTSSGSFAHIIPEEPWHPVPAAYLRSIFYLSLKPIDWELIAKEYESIEEQGYGVESVYELIDQALSQRDASTSIRAAIEEEDSFALFVASTRAVSGVVRNYLSAAADKIDEPGAGLTDVKRAQQVFRAFHQDYIRQADSDGYTRLGRAWLEATSSVGNGGVFGVGGTASDRASYERSRDYIEGYLLRNYEPESFMARTKMYPLPEIAYSANPNITLEQILPPGSDMNDQDPLPRLVLNFEARGFDETDLFLAAYGDMIFDSAEIFGEPAKSLGIACSTCHNRSDINQRFFIPGISHQRGAADVDGHFFNSRFNDMRSDSLDIPSLRGLRFTGPYGRDGRFASLREFSRNVIVNEFGGAEPTPLMLDALVTYMLEFDWLPSPYLDKDGSLNDAASEAATRGETLFNKPFAGMGGISCATCHMPGFNFIDGQRHDIGSGTPAEPGARDSFFDTPTLLNITYTAPYMHNGSLATLEAVVEWFDTQFELDLSTSERDDLTAYLDAVGTGVLPYEVFDDENTLFSLAWAELSTFISTLDTLIPAKDVFHADLLIDTVAPDLVADASALRDTSQIPLVHELANRLRVIQNTYSNGDWLGAANLWTEYKGVASEYGPTFK